MHKAISIFLVFYLFYLAYFVGNNLKPQRGAFPLLFFRGNTLFWKYKRVWGLVYPCSEAQLMLQSGKVIWPTWGYLTCVEISTHDGRTHFSSTSEKRPWVAAIEPAYFWLAANGLANNLVQQLLWVTLVKYLHFAGLRTHTSGVGLRHCTVEHFCSLIALVQSHRGKVS